MKQRPDLSPRKQAARASRTDRLAEALRQNLTRRKEQARARNAPDRLALDPTKFANSLSGEPLPGKSIRDGETTAD
jgi:hypothetical protein